MSGDRVYLDWAATAPIRAEVRAAVAAYVHERFGNPSSQHWAGREARDGIDSAREQVARLGGPRFGPVDVVFTSGGTEANSLALLGLVGSLREDRGLTPPVAISRVEHSSVIAAALELERQGVPLHWLPVDAQGVVRLEAVQAALAAGVRVVSIMAANNESGVEQPLQEIVHLCRQAPERVYVHADAVQAAGYRSLSGTREASPDLVTLSAHKLGGLKGVGALLHARGVPLRPLLRGGDQERGLRAGTQNVVGIVAFGEAARLALENRNQTADRVAGLRERLERGVLGTIADARLHGAGAARLPHISLFDFANADADLLLLGLDMEGIAASSGSACVAGRTEPSHVLMAMGHGVADARRAVRFSLGHASQEADVDRLLQVLPGAVARVRTTTG